MFRIKGLKKYPKQLTFAVLVLLLMFLAGPTLRWWWPGYWWGTTLIVLMNEHEARPCGGFATAYGVLKLPLGGAQLHNSFAFPPVDLGTNSEPLRQVAVDRKFWDLGDKLNQAQCAGQFAVAYEQAYQKAPARVVLIQAGVVEDWIGALGTLRAGEYRLNEGNFFATTSRLVADIDRHDEAALESRKNPLSIFGKKLVVQTVLRPWRWYAVTRTLGRAEQSGAIYWHKTGRPESPDWQRQRERLFTVSEWNLGGGKSSRYLAKDWVVSLRQLEPALWEAKIRITAEHLGGEDEPLSQTWRGGFALHMPGGKTQFVSAEIEPGERFVHTETINLSQATLASDDAHRVWLYAPAYQHWHTQLRVSALAQQAIKASSQFAVQDNTLHWLGELKPSGQGFYWQHEPDETVPFLTWHKPLQSVALTPQMRQLLQHGEDDLLVEVHFNEPVRLSGRVPLNPSSTTDLLYGPENLGIRLKDRDYAVSDITQNPTLKRALLLADQQTLLLSAEQAAYQTDERFYLEIDQVADVWGNTADIKSRTVITR